MWLSSAQTPSKPSILGEVGSHSSTEARFRTDAFLVSSNFFAEIFSTPHSEGAFFANFQAGSIPSPLVVTAVLPQPGVTEYAPSAMSPVGNVQIVGCISACFDGMTGVVVVYILYKIV